MPSESLKKNQDIRSDQYHFTRCAAVSRSGPGVGEGEGKSDTKSPKSYLPPNKTNYDDEDVKKNNPYAAKKKRKHRRK